MNVSSPTAAASKWTSRAGAAGQTYATAVASSNVDQAAAAAAAEGTWSAAVAQAAQNKTFSTQVLKAGTASWKAGVANKGAARYAPGVNAAGPKYTTNVTPYFNALSSLTLPVRGVKGSNIARVQAVDDALMATKAQIG